MGCICLKSVPSPDPENTIKLHIPIYIAKCSYRKVTDDEISFEKGDEMELIEKRNSSTLYVNHLRSGLQGNIHRTMVTIDNATPLRLVEHDVVIIQKCLIEYNVPGAYLIRRSTQSSNNFVLSILQENRLYNTRCWNYLISINPSTHRFFFPQEAELRNRSFSSFRHLIHDMYVKKIIPLTEILPNELIIHTDLWQIPLNDLSIGEKIGEGKFSQVFRGYWTQNETRRDVAIKIVHMAKDSMSHIVKREIEALKNLAHRHIVTFYGVSEKVDTHEIYIITELMEKGDLKSFLKKQKTLLDRSTILRYTSDISLGMCYLENRNCVHRDLACRNILIGPNGQHVKVADFGLSVLVNRPENYETHQLFKQNLPIRWLAPELLEKQDQYSMKSDVWSFGILLIEIWSKGEDPYRGQHILWVESAVAGGYVHEKPKHCPLNFYKKLILKCLAFQPNIRPSFIEISKILQEWGSEYVF